MKVNSSIIDTIDYAGGLMTAKFKNGKVYQYEGVQPDDYRKIVTWASIGKEFKNITKVKKYKYKVLW